MWDADVCLNFMPQLPTGCSSLVVELFMWLWSLCDYDELLIIILRTLRQFSVTHRVL